MQEEIDIQCQFCFETISILIDTSVDQQSYIEDCSVCCRPIQITANCTDNEVKSVTVCRS